MKYVLFLGLFLMGCHWGWTKNWNEHIYTDSVSGKMVNGALQKTYIETVQDTAKKKRLIDKLRFGGTFGVQFGNATVVNFSPAVGVLLTDKLMVGVGLTYQYVNWKGFNGDSHMFGARVFGQYDIWGGILAHAEYEWLNYNNHGSSDRLNSHALFLGGGYQYRLSERIVAQVILLYNVLNRANSPYINPFLVRVGVFF